MIKPLLSEIKSVVNETPGAKDTSRAFTYIEFVKEFGYGDDPDDFIVLYKDYLIKWNQRNNGDTTLSNEEFVQEKMIQILKTITLDYSSYEEQDFIANLDWENPNHLRAVLPLYCRKIREITEFYRKCRNEAHLIVYRNSFKGSTSNIEEIIYQKVFDYVFNNRDVSVTYADIKRDLMISIENYVDTYSEYFDIPRRTVPGNESRRRMLSANMNDVQWQDYIKISSVVSDTLYSGSMYLKEIPLIASLGLDLSQECVGDLLALKNTLVEQTTINLIPLNEQVALRRRFYEKFLGVDLYYLYTDSENNIVKMDILCQAKNKSGNLLNVGTVDRAAVDADQYELLSNVGLFFKPDKTSIIKVNAKDYSWEIDEEALIPNSLYVFPNPDKYGDIGNNKSSVYPFTMRYRLDYDIKNMSSGEACDDPLIYLTDSSWRAYYTKQDEDFRIFDNTNWEYSFTSLANKGILHQYQVDEYGNQFASVKGFNERHFDQYGNEIAEVDWSDDDADIVYEFAEETIDVPENVESDEPSQDSDQTRRPILLNGGYFEDPYKPGHPFDFTKNIRIDTNYNWTGIILAQKPLVVPRLLYPTVNIGEFGHDAQIEYVDHWRVTTKTEKTKEEESITKATMKRFFSRSLMDGTSSSNRRIVTVKKTRTELNDEAGVLYLRKCSSLNEKPEIFIKENVKSFQIIFNTIVIEYQNKYELMKYDFDGENFEVKPDTVKEVIKFDQSKVLFVEKEKSFYFCSTKVFDDRIAPVITKYDTRKQSLETIIDSINEPLEDDNFSKREGLSGIKGIYFSYNSSMGRFLLAYANDDKLGTTYIYEHQFKLNDRETFEKTLQSNVYTTLLPDENVVYSGETVEEMTDKETGETFFNGKIENYVQPQYDSDGRLVNQPSFGCTVTDIKGLYVGHGRNLFVPLPEDFDPQYHSGQWERTFMASSWCIGSMYSSIEGAIDMDFERNIIITSLDYVSAIANSSWGWANGKLVVQAYDEVEDNWIELGTKTTNYPSTQYALYLHQEHLDLNNSKAYKKYRFLLTPTTPSNFHVTGISSIKLNGFFIKEQG